MSFSPFFVLSLLFLFSPVLCFYLPTVKEKWIADFDGLTGAVSTQQLANQAARFLPVRHGLVSRSTLTHLHLEEDKEKRERERESGCKREEEGGREEE